jgi:hypothetical protein
MDQTWVSCVKRAKKKLGTPEYQIIKGPVLREAQKMYCASSKNKNW